MNAIAQHWFIELSEGNVQAKEQKRTLLAMPVQVLSADSAYQHSNSSVAFKQYSFIDLERAGLIELAAFCAPVRYTHISEPITQWSLTDLGSEVVALFKEAA